MGLEAPTENHLHDDKNECDGPEAGSHNAEASKSL